MSVQDLKYVTSPKATWVYFGTCNLFVIKIRHRVPSRRFVNEFDLPDTGHGFVLNHSKCFPARDSAAAADSFTVYLKLE